MIAVNVIPVLESRIELADELTCSVVLTGNDCPAPLTVRLSKYVAAGKLAGFTCTQIRPGLDDVALPCAPQVMISQDGGTAVTE